MSEGEPCGRFYWLLLAVMNMSRGDSFCKYLLWLHVASHVARLCASQMPSKYSGILLKFSGAGFWLSLCFFKCYSYTQVNFALWVAELWNIHIYPYVFFQGQNTIMFFFFFDPMLTCCKCIHVDLSQHNLPYCKQKPVCREVLRGFTLR